MSDAPRGPIERVPPQPVQRPRALLIDAVDPINLEAVRPYGEGPLSWDPAERIVGGYTFCPVGCDPLVPQANRFCEFPFDDADTDNDLLDLPDVGGSGAGGSTEGQGPDSTDAPSFSSFAIFTGEEAPQSWPIEMLAQRAEARIAARYSAALAHELLTGAETGNPSLASSVTDAVSIAAPPGDAVFILEDLAATLQGQRVIFHADPATFTLLADAWGAEQDEKETGQDPNPRPFRTPTGHLLVGDAGHDGTYGPFDGDDQLVTDADGRWVYASLAVQSWLGPVEAIGTESATFGRERNRRRLVRFRQALLGFDPCFVGAVQVEVPTYDLAIGGETTA